MVGEKRRYGQIFITWVVDIVNAFSGVINVLGRCESTQHIFVHTASIYNVQPTAERFERLLKTSTPVGHVIVLRAHSQSPGVAP